MVTSSRTYYCLKDFASSSGHTRQKSHASQALHLACQVLSKDPQDAQFQVCSGQCTRRSDSLSRLVEAPREQSSQASHRMAKQLEIERQWEEGYGRRMKVW